MEKLRREIHKSGYVVYDDTLILKAGGKRLSFKQFYQNIFLNPDNLSLETYEKYDKKGYLHGWCVDFFRDGSIEAKSYFMHGRRCVFEKRDKNGKVVKFELGETDEEFQDMVGDLDQFRETK